MNTPESLLALSRAFQESRVLLTGAELDVFTLLSKEALTAGTIAARLGADGRALTITLDALAAMELLVHNGQLFEDVLRSAKLTHHELNAALRRGGCACVDDVHSAILENNGSISVTPKVKA